MKQENNKILKKSFLHSWLSSLAILAIYYNVYDDVVFKTQWWPENLKIRKRDQIKKELKIKK